MSRGARSLDVLSREAREELSAQLMHFEALDTKSGLVLGFAGLLVALGPAESSAWIDAGRVAAVASAVNALSAFFPRDYPTLDLLQLRTSYLAAEPSFTELTLLDTRMVMLQEAWRVIDQKALRLKRSIAVLVAAISFGAAGLLVDF